MFTGLQGGPVLSVMRRAAFLMVFACLSSCAIQPLETHKPEQDLRQRLARASRLQVEASASYEARDYRRAALLYKSVLDILEESLGPTNLAVGLAANDLAEVYRAKGQYSKAEVLYRQALTVLNTIPDRDPKHLTTVLNNLGLLYLQTGEYDHAETLMVRALTLRRDSFGSDRQSVAWSMNNLALLYKTLGRYSAALALYEQAQAIQEGLLPRDDLALSVVLDNLASLHLALGHYARAKALYQRTLDLQERVLGANHPGLATPLNNLASLHLYLAEYDEAGKLYRRALSLHGVGSPGGTSLATAALLNNLASLHATFGHYAKALDQFQRILNIQKDFLAEKHPDIANTLSNLAWVHQMIGQYSEAERLYRQALDIREQVFGPEHIKVAHSFRNLADLYVTTGKFGQAEPFYQRAQYLTEKALGASHPDVAVILNNLALLYRILGDYAQAERLYRRALDTTEAALGPKHPGVATTLSNMALLFYYQKEYAHAEPLVRRALAIREQTFPLDHPDTAVNLVVLARIELANGALDASQRLLKRALASQRRVLGENHASVAFTLNSLAKVHKTRGDKLPSADQAQHEYQEAKHLYHRALTVATSAGQPEVLWRIQHNLSQLLAAEKNPSAAILFALEAVTTLQGLRRAVSSLSKELQQSFLEARYQVYRHLADLLISQGRIPEAQQVLGMLKEAEYFDFVRRSSDEALEDTTIDLEGVASFSKFYKFKNNLVDLGQELSGLRQEFELDPREKARRSELDEIIATAQKRFFDYLSTLETKLLEFSGRSQDPLFSQLRNEAIQLMGMLRDLGPGWVLIHTLITDDGLHLILTTPDTQLVRFSKVQARDLRQAITDFREALESRSNLSSIQALAKRIYGWVLAPLASDLEQAHAKVLALSLDGSLRYLPIAALYDGEQFMVEIYSVVMYTETAKLNFIARPSKSWHVAGLGASKAPADSNLPDLPAVIDELNGIVKEENVENDKGVLPGIVFFDEDFTEDTLKKLLEMKRYSVLHVAGHFSLNTGNMRSCSLFLGDGNKLSLEDIKGGDKFRFNFLKELVTLSACNTAVGSSVFGSGIEVESFAALAQKKGAKSVLATLWPVSDNSTGLFMQLFYGFRERPDMTKAEALRRAQLALLRDAWMEPEGAVIRGVFDVEGTKIKHYRHPYYWAPFVLMGNGL